MKIDIHAIMIITHLSVPFLLFRSFVTAHLKMLLLSPGLLERELETEVGVLGSCWRNLGKPNVGLQLIDEFSE